MHPILIRFSDSFFIGTYGALIAIGLLAGSALAAWLGRRRGLNPDIFFDIVFIAVASGFLGARILYIITEFNAFLKTPGEFIFSRTGFVFFGGFIAAAAATWAYLRFKKLDPWTVGDVLMPALALAHGFGRLGCHFAGCCYGGVCRIPLGIHVPRIVMPDGALWPNAFADQAATGLVSDAPGSVSLSVWPVQLMESAALFSICAFLLWFGMKPRPKGLIIGMYLMIYSAVRFSLEYLRGDLERGVFLNGLLSTSQIVSIVLFVVGVVVVLKRSRLPVR